MEATFDWLWKHLVDNGVVITMAITLLAFFGKAVYNEIVKSKERKREHELETLKAANTCDNHIKMSLYDDEKSALSEIVGALIVCVEKTELFVSHSSWGNPSEETNERINSHCIDLNNLYYEIRKNAIVIDDVIYDQLVTLFREAKGMLLKFEQMLNTNNEQSRIALQATIMEKKKKIEESLPETIIMVRKHLQSKRTELI
ncbi:MAG: hypothetical protein FWE40_09000 [Oscillospiraceae bacterium]|nr:hypothetical protein [Oscillospiraceae bacterium]